jgi:hypothetical protein
MGRTLQRNAYVQPQIVSIIFHIMILNFGAHAAFLPQIRFDSLVFVSESSSQAPVIFLQSISREFPGARRSKKRDAKSPVTHPVSLT